MYLLIFGALLVVGLLYFGKRRSDAYLQAVTGQVVHKLRVMGEPDQLIKYYADSIAFSIFVKKSFGKLSSAQAAEAALEDYGKKRDRWRDAPPG
jgi:hypothetical protein